ncbi:MAG: SGNH/GDSL hydrolase family protein [Roseibium sp.]
MAAGKDPISILCFGDSLTWGFDPIDRSRYSHDIRWTRLMQADLGPEYYVIEDGLNSRTTVYEDPIMGDKNGLAHLATALKVHMPIDLLIIMLGTNNLKSRFGLSAEEIAMSLTQHMELATKSDCGPDYGAPKVLLMSPPPLGPMAGMPFEAQFSDKSVRESHRLAEHYKLKADEFGVAFFDTGTKVSASPIDAIHLDSEPQAGLAKAVASEVKKLV